MARSQERGVNGFLKWSLGVTGMEFEDINGRDRRTNTD